VLNWLHTFPGDSWQQRWHASGGQDQSDWRESIASATPSPHLGPRLLVLICADVIRPSLGWLLRLAPVRRNLATEMAAPATPRRSQRSPNHAGRAGSGCRPASRRPFAIAPPWRSRR
jgi:hypothetical protein